MAETEQNNWGRWGAADERGTANLITPEVTARAAGLVRTGRVYPLAIPLEAGGPLWPGRHENWHVCTHQNVAGPGLGGAEDILMINTHGSTHMDALAHIVADGVMYNGYPAAKAIDSRGTGRCGIEKLGAIVTRGLLADLPPRLGEEHLPPGHVISRGELEWALAEHDLRPEPGDVILIRTGWMKVWAKDREKFKAAQPGIGLEAAKWAAELGVAGIGADNSAVEAFPVAGDFLPVHREFIRNRGGYLMELFDLEQLAADGVHEFMFVASPLRISRGLGSPITPLAVC